MFVEPRISNIKKGCIEVICGSMFSGKTEELIRRVKRAQFAHQTVEIFKPNVDTRYDDKLVISHDNSRILSTPIQASQEIILLAHEVNVIGIDEAQFFDEELPTVVTHLAKIGKRVIIAGLDMDFKGVPFGPMAPLLAIADYITKLHAVCVRCGDPALFSYRLSDNENRVLLGELDNYEPRCRHCYYITY